MQLDENTYIGEILDRYAGSEAVFLGLGMSCLGCPAARGETLGEACEIHGVELSDLLDKLHKQIAG